MKKKFIVLFLIVVCINTIFGKEIFNGSGKLEPRHNYSLVTLNDPNYSFCVSTSNEKSVVVNELTFVTEDDEIFITYDDAKIAAGDASGSFHYRTSLYIVDSKGVNITAKSFNVAKNNPISIRIVSEYYLSGNLVEVKTLAATTIFSDYLLQESQENLSFVNVDDKVKLVSISGSLPGLNNDYSLSVSAAVTGIDKNNVWYIKKDTPISINYEPASYNNSSKDWSYSYTELRINGACCTSLPSLISTDLKIELIYVFADYSTPQDEFVLASVKFCVKDIPEAPKQTDKTILEGWSKDDVEVAVTTTYAKKEIAYFEYSLDNEKTWQQGSSYKTNVEDTLNQNIYFRVIDYVGNVSPSLAIEVKVDKTCPVIPDSEGIDKWIKNNVEIYVPDTGSPCTVPEEIDNNVKIYVSDTGSPCTLIINGEEKEGGYFLLAKEGEYEIQAKDAAGNYSEKKLVKIDKTSPLINAYCENQEYIGGWTNKNVSVCIKDNLSGIAEVSVNDAKEEIQETETTILFSETEEYNISVVDKVGNTTETTVQIDKSSPLIQWGEVSYGDIKQREEKVLLDSYTINFIAEDEHSGIGTDGFCLKREQNVVKTNSNNLFYKENLDSIDRTQDQIINYYLSATDNAGNVSEEISKQITIPQEVKIQVVDISQENDILKRTTVSNDFVTVGILINKIDFNNYSEIKLNRKFLGKVNEDNGEREYITLDKYQEFFDSTISKEKIKTDWEALEQVQITLNDVSEKIVKIGNEEYWYFEDKIPVISGLGHKGIVYQPEWTWKNQTITEKGSYTEIEKTANTPGILKIRLIGTNREGTEERYLILNSDGEKIVDESSDDFFVPVTGEIGIEFKIEDKDFDDYDVHAKGLLLTNFINEETLVEEKQEMEIAMEGCFSSGKILSRMIDGEERRIFCTENNLNDWNSFGEAKIKLYYNKTFNMRITMEEGYNGKNGNLKDVTKSSVIKLKANNPDLGGFHLLVGEEAGYNKEGITAQPHQLIELGLERNENHSELQNIEWDFGDGKKKNGNNVTHEYGQNPNRTGNTSEYDMKIKCVQDQQVKLATIKVYIVDTQYGALFGDEEWIGEHVVLGKIQIPEGKTLTVKENLNDSNNETKVIVIGTPEIKRKPSIDVLPSGRLVVQGSENNQIVFSEGKNGETFSEIEDGDSKKWGGIVVKKDAMFEVKENTDVLIKHTTTGLFLEKDSSANINVLNIEKASDVGLINNGTFVANQIVIKDTPIGIEIGNKMSLSNLTIKNCSEGLICESEDTNSITLNIENVDINGYGERGVYISENFTLISKGSDKFYITGFKGGILNEGEIEISHEDATVENCSTYGIKSSGSITAEKLNIRGQTERGIILLPITSEDENSIDFISIADAEIGIHAFDDSILNAKSLSITKAEYGIKTEGINSSYPKLYIDSFVKDEKSEIMIDWYDCNQGPLTAEEITERELEAISLHNLGKE